MQTYSSSGWVMFVSIKARLVITVLCPTCREGNCHPDSLSLMDCLQKLDKGADDTYQQQVGKSASLLKFEYNVLATFRCFQHSNPLAGLNIKVCIIAQSGSNDMQDRANVNVPQNAADSMDLQQLEFSAAALQQRLVEMLHQADKPATPSGEDSTHVRSRPLCAVCSIVTYLLRQFCFQMYLSAQDDWKMYHNCTCSCAMFAAAVAGNIQQVSAHPPLMIILAREA